MPRILRRTHALAVTAMCLSLLVGGLLEIRAQQRTVTVNGALLGPQELAMADRAAGFPLPDGDYWLDRQTGVWGVVGGPALGRVPPDLRQGSGHGERHRSRSADVGGVTGSEAPRSAPQLWNGPAGETPDDGEEWAGLRVAE